jgi:hypothetical protein
MITSPKSRPAAPLTANDQLRLLLDRWYTFRRFFLSSMSMSQHDDAAGSRSQIDG